MLKYIATSYMLLKTKLIFVNFTIIFSIIFYFFGKFFKYFTQYGLQRKRSVIAIFFLIFVNGYNFCLFLVFLDKFLLLLVEICVNFWGNFLYYPFHDFHCYCIYSCISNLKIFSMTYDPPMDATIGISSLSICRRFVENARRYTTVLLEITVKTKYGN